MYSFFLHQFCTAKVRESQRKVMRLKYFCNAHRRQVPLSRSLIICLEEIVPKLKTRRQLLMISFHEIVHSKLDAREHIF
jgi:hypothetical protein